MGTQEELGSLQGHNPCQDRQDARRQSAAHRHRSQSDAARLVRVLQARRSVYLQGNRQVHPPTTAYASAQANTEAIRDRAVPCRSQTVAQRVLRTSRAARPVWGLVRGETLLIRITTDWRAVCGKTARTVRRAGRGHPSRPLSGARLLGEDGGGAGGGAILRAVERAAHRRGLV